MHIYQIIFVLASIGLFVFVIDFIRRGLLKEKYSVLWLAASFAVIVLSLWNRLLDRAAELIGVSYAPSLLFIVAFIFVLLIILHFSVVISILHDKNKTLAQELTLLKASLKKAGIKDLTEQKGDRL